MRLNNSMSSLLKDEFGLSYPELHRHWPKWSSIVHEVRLPRRLTTLCHSELLDVGGAMVLKPLYERAKTIGRDNFIDTVGFEAFVNKINIDEFTQENQLKVSIKAMLELMRSFTKQGVKAPLTFIISIDDLSSTVRFHSQANAKHWLADDLNNYLHESVLTLDSGELINEFERH